MSRGMTTKKLQVQKDYRTTSDSYHKFLIDLLDLKYVDIRHIKGLITNQLLTDHYEEVGYTDEQKRYNKF